MYSSAYPGLKTTANDSCLTSSEYVWGNVQENRVAHSNWALSTITMMLTINIAFDALLTDRVDCHSLGTESLLHV